MERRPAEVTKTAFLNGVLSGGPNSVGLWWRPGEGVGLLYILQRRIGPGGDYTIGQIKSQLESEAAIVGMKNVQVTVKPPTTGTIEIEVTCSDFSAKIPTNGP